MLTFHAAYRRPQIANIDFNTLGNIIVQYTMINLTLITYLITLLNIIIIIILLLKA